MGADFSTTFLSQLKAHKLIQFESSEIRRNGGDSELFRLPTGALADAIIAQPMLPKIHQLVFRRGADHANAIAVAAATIAVLIAITAPAGLFAGLGFVVCAFLVNVSAPLQSRLSGRKQQSILSRYLVSLCESTVVCAGIMWARNPFPIGLIVALLWLAVQDGVVPVLSNRIYRARALDASFLVLSIAIGGGSDSTSVSSVLIAAAVASLCASITLTQILRQAGVAQQQQTGNGNTNSSDGNKQEGISAGAGNALSFLALIDLDLVLLASGFSRFVFGVAALAAIFGGSCCGVIRAAVAFIAAVEIIRLLSLSAALKTPLFQNITTAYVDGVFDLCHIGHKNLVNFASTLGNRVVVGVLSDEDCSVYKRPPIMTTSERVIEVTALMNVSRVVRGSPCFGLTEEFLRTEGIDVVVCGEEYMEKPVEEDKYYHVARRLGIAVAAPRTQGVSTSQIIKRIQQRDAGDLVAKDKATGASTVKE